MRKDPLASQELVFTANRPVGNRVKSTRSAIGKATGMIATFPSHYHHPLCLARLEIQSLEKETPSRSFGRAAGTRLSRKNEAMTMQSQVWYRAWLYLLRRSSVPLYEGYLNLCICVGANRCERESAFS